QLGKSPILPLRPAKFERDVLPFLVTGLGEAFAECSHLLCPFGGGAGVEESDHRLLRARRERPRGRRAASKRNELAPVDLCDHSITSSARASNVGGTSSPSDLAVLRLMTSSYLVGACTGRSAGFSPLRIRST